MPHNRGHHHKPRILFILKRREDYSTDLPEFFTKTVSTGMYNSVRFISEMLNANGIEAKVIIVIDNNCIDREVTAYRPTHVFIEGYWVVPEKFPILKRLHPHVRWIVRCHSELPFLAQEGIGMNWTFNYLKEGIAVSGNSPRIANEIRGLAKLVISDQEKLKWATPFLPNYYPTSGGGEAWKIPTGSTLDISCFGAIRPLKNQLTQAVAAIEFARMMNLNLRFHMNIGRIESQGANVLKNIRGLFANTGTSYQLIEHNWLDHSAFLELLKSMDIAMQVSFTETFNIVSADATFVGTPIVVSKEVPWSIKSCQADPTSVHEIVEVLHHTFYHQERNVQNNRHSLARYSDNTEHVWMRYFGHREPSLIDRIIAWFC